MLRTQEGKRRRAFCLCTLWPPLLAQRMPSSVPMVCKLSDRIPLLQSHNCTDLIAVGQKDQALQTLHDVITSKRHRTWAKVLEDIMKKYVQLCVELRKGKFAKEGLHQYKIICQVCVEYFKKKKKSNLINYRLITILWKL